MSSVPEDPSAFVAPSRERLPAASAMAVGPPVRLLALSDGIYAIAMTLLVLDLSLPEGLDSAEFHRELRAMIPQFLAYGLSFTLLVGFWQDQRRIHMLVRQADEGFIRLTALGLGAVALVPFPTSMLSDYTDEPVAVALYSAVIAAIDLIHLAQFTLLCHVSPACAPVPYPAACSGASAPNWAPPSWCSGRPRSSPCSTRPSRCTAGSPSSR